jgi:hypothetical protein
LFWIFGKFDRFLKMDVLCGAFLTATPTLLSLFERSAMGRELHFLLKNVEVMSQNSTVPKSDSSLS